MTHQVVGYIRVSSSSQNISRQLVDIPLDKQFVDIISGSVKVRPALEECMSYVREGDALIVDSIDRLARNLRHLQEILHALITKGVSIKFVQENLTFTAQHDAMANLMIQMMGAFAEFERNMIRSRQKEGIEAARKAGKHLGRKPSITQKMKDEAIELVKQGTSIRKTAMMLKLSRPSIYNILEGANFERKWQETRTI
jgi:DNA invertase Pin-like site-specific DNA recombinase